MVTIRPFEERDYPALTALGNALYPDYEDTEEQVRFGDTNRPERVKWGRFVAEVDGQIVGSGWWGNNDEYYHPQHFDVDIGVLQEYRGKGVGKALYATLLSALEPHQPIKLSAHTRETDERSLRFLAERGFVEVMREWESRFYPESFDPAAWSDSLAPLDALGLRVQPLTELAGDPERDRKLYELDGAICADMPSTDPYTAPDFGAFDKNVLQNPAFYPQGWFVALDAAGNYVGESVLWKSLTDDSLYVGSTGVLREWRRKGIARALKVIACTHAKEAGASHLKTWNATTNVGMLAINEKLGFVRQPAWVSLEKSL